MFLLLLCYDSKASYCHHHHHHNHHHHHHHYQCHYFIMIRTLCFACHSSVVVCWSCCCRCHYRHTSSHGNPCCHRHCPYVPICCWYVGMLCESDDAQLVACTFQDETKEEVRKLKLENERLRSQRTWRVTSTADNVNEARSTIQFTKITGWTCIILGLFWWFIANLGRRINDFKYF